MQVRLIKTLEDGDEVWACAISKDNTWLVSAVGGLFDDCNFVRIWSLTEDKIIYTFKGHSEMVSGCVISPDETEILSHSKKEIKIWNRLTGQERLTILDQAEVQKCAIAPNGKWFVSASSDHALRIWDINSGALLLTLAGHTHELLDCKISANGQFIVSASMDETLRIWDSHTGQELLSLRGHTDWARSCSISPDDKWILSVSDDETIKIWEVSTGKELKTLEEYDSLLMAGTFSPDGSWLVSVGTYQALRIWDTLTYEVLETFHDPEYGIVTSCAVSADGKLIIASNFDYTVRVWEVS